MKTKVKKEGYLITFGKDAFRRSTAISYKRGIRVLIADDHPHLIAGLEKDLRRDRQIKIIGNAKSYEELLLRADYLQPDVVLLDLKMPGVERIDLREFITKLRAINHCKVIIFTNETGWARIQRCLECGARGYIEKAISLGGLAEFIHKVYEDEEIVVYTADKLPEINFSKRQKEILHFMADGIENEEIASLLGLQVKSVQACISLIKGKMEEGFDIKPVKPRTLIFLASKLGFGSKFR